MITLMMMIILIMMILYQWLWWCDKNNDNDDDDDNVIYDDDNVINYDYDDVIMMVMMVMMMPPCLMLMVWLVCATPRRARISRTHSTVHTRWDISTVNQQNKFVIILMDSHRMTDSAVLFHKPITMGEHPLE